MNTAEQESEIPEYEEVPPRENLVPPEPKAEWVPPSDEPLIGVKPTKQIYVSKEDLLESENLQLKAQLMGQEIMLIQLQIEQKVKAQQELHAQLLAKRTELEKRYDISLATHSIRPTDGLVFSNGAPGNSGVMQALQEQARRGRVG